MLTYAMCSEQGVDLDQMRAHSVFDRKSGVCARERERERERLLYVKDHRDFIS